MGVYDELKTAEERRAWIENLLERSHGKSEVPAQSQAITDALGGRRDKSTVLKVLTEVLGVEPVEKNGVYCVADWEVVFDNDNYFLTMSASSGVPGMIQSEVKVKGDT